MAKWSDAHIHKFLGLYENHECLWNIHLVDYRKTDARTVALQEIVREMGLPISVAELKIKIKNIRTTYNREIAKIEASKRSGAGTDDVYKPTLTWFSEADRFLRPIVEARSSINNLDTQASEVSVDGNVTLNENPVAETIDEERTAGTSGSVKRKLCTSPKNKKQKNVKQTRTVSIERAIDKLDEIVKAHREDEFDTFAKHLANQMRQLPLNRALLLQNRFQSMLTEERITCLAESNYPSRTPTFDSVSSIESTPSTSLSNDTIWQTPIIFSPTNISVVSDSD